MMGMRLPPLSCRSGLRSGAACLTAGRCEQGYRSDRVFRADVRGDRGQAGAAVLLRLAGLVDRALAKRDTRPASLKGATWTRRGTRAILETKELASCCRHGRCAWHYRRLRQQYVVGAGQKYRDQIGGECAKAYHPGRVLPRYVACSFADGKSCSSE